MGPDQRLLNLPAGPGGLTDGELLAILLDATPAAVPHLERTIHRLGGLRKLATASSTELLLLGFPPTCAARLLAAVEFVCRVS